MKRVVVFACALMVVVASQSTHAQTAYDFLAELEEYSATHTREDVVTYTHSRITQMTGEAARSSFTINGVLLSDNVVNGVLLSDSSFNGVLLSDSNGVLLSDSSLNGVLLSDSNGVLLSDSSFNGVLLSDSSFNGVLLSDSNGVLLSDSLRHLCSSCRRNYIGELNASASRAREVLVSSNETMSMSDLVVSAASALATHEAGIVLAHQHRIACYENIPL